MKNRIRAELLEHGALATIQSAIGGAFGRTDAEIEEALLEILDIVLQEQKNFWYSQAAKQICDVLEYGKGSRNELLKIMMDAIVRGRVSREG